MRYIANNLNDLDFIAKEIVSNINHRLVCINGEMGAGKTTLIKQLVKKIGSNDHVSSPTFSIVNEYNTDQTKIYHFDLFRLNSINEALDFGIEDYLYDSKSILLIEWPGIIKELLDEPYHKIKIMKDHEKRQITFN